MMASRISLLLCLSILKNTFASGADEQVHAQYQLLFGSELERVFQSPRTLHQMHMRAVCPIDNILMGCASYANGDDFGIVYTTCSN